MKKSFIIKLTVALTVIAMITALILVVLSMNAGAETKDLFGGEKALTFEKTAIVEKLLEYTNSFIVVKHKQLGGTHYAYTAALAETNTSADIFKEYNFDAGSELVGLSIVDNGDGTVSTYEKTLLSLTNGVIRDPSVNTDGTKVVFSKKDNTYDDFHVYEMELTSGSFNVTQLTFGNGRSDIEPQYLANGCIVFSSNRCVQTVDCWITPVSNMYIMDADGSNVRRVGYDQVHTTYPTVASDGRVLYTRWDYNDRTQMFVQSLFQMFQDGTYQTEVFGNDANFPTTLLHTRDIPGVPGQYVSIASGHHVNQLGKLVRIDTNADRNDKSAVSFLYPDGGATYSRNVDAYGQSGRVFKFPYALDEQVLLVSSCAEYSGKNTAYSIYLCDMSKPWTASVELVKGTQKLPASQIVPVKRTDVYNRVSTVNYAANSGTYYVADVYAGEAMKGVERGTVKYLRVVKLVYRSSAIGATFAKGSGEGDPFSPIATGNASWDVKSVLGVVPVMEDGSALFRVPSDTPVYFQLLDENGCMIQTMRSWSTLMPGESFSCVGCHENKNTAPASGGGITLAMKAGVADLQPDLWMKGHEEYENADPYGGNNPGFSYVDLVQPIFDSSCAVCHSDTDTALAQIRSERAGAEESVKKLGYVIENGSLWSFAISGGRSGEHYAPFGDPSGGQTDVNTLWTDGTLTLNREFTFTQYNKDCCRTQLELRFSGSVTVKINGETVYADSSPAIVSKTVELTADQASRLAVGTNSIEITVSGGTKYIDAALRSGIPDQTITFFERGETWKYLMSSANNAPSGWNQNGFDDGAWQSGQAPFGDRDNFKTSWTGSQSYIWIRKSFNVSAEQLAAMKGGRISFNIFYDDSMTMYVNGKQVMKESGWNDAFEIISIDVDPADVFRAGENVIAISLHNTGGGRQIDTSMSCAVKVDLPATAAQFSLSGKTVDPENNRMARSFPLSYLLLTASTPSSRGNQVGGINWVGNSAGKYVKWISTMSQAEMLEPYYSGAYRSPLVQKLRSGHGGLSEEEIRLIECWIDLACPCFGTYDENESFSEDAMRMYVERENKRKFYDQWDRCVKMGLGGVLPEGTIEASYTTAGKSYKGKGDGYLILEVASKTATGDKLKVKVTGSKYLAVTINERQGEALLYLPDGEFTYEIPSNFANVTNLTMRAAGNGYYRSFTILLRIPTEEELSEVHDLALNPYDLYDAERAFPHASSTNAPDTLLQHKPAAAIDGFVSNGSDRTWPFQACAVKQNGSLKIDFGREVKAYELQILMRAAAKDTHLLSAVVTLSNGEKKEILLHDTDKFMTFDLGGVTISSLEIGGFTAVEDGTVAFTEVRVLGTEA